MLFYAYMPMLLCDCQSFIKESYLLTYLLSLKCNSSMYRMKSVDACECVV